MIEYRMLRSRSYVYHLIYDPELREVTRRYMSLVLESGGYKICSISNPGQINGMLKEARNYGLHECPDKRCNHDERA